MLAPSVAAPLTNEPTPPAPTDPAPTPPPERTPNRLHRQHWTRLLLAGIRGLVKQQLRFPDTLRSTAVRVARDGEKLWPPPPCPDEGMVLIRNYCVDRYESHLVVQKDGEWVIHPHHQRPPEGVRYEARSMAGVFPQGYISRVESQRACKNAGKRLCSWLEWRRACQGSRWRRHPYRGPTRRNRCNIGKEHLLRRFFGPKSGWKYDEHFNSPQLNQEPGFLARSGQYKECRTPERVYDMSGNLHEWVSDSVNQDFIDKMEKDDVERVEQPWAAGNGMFLGGFYSTFEQHGPGCYYTTIAHEPKYHDYSTGFRCCATALKPRKRKR